MIATSTEQPTARPASSGRLAFLDGLRALAALWVVSSHLWISQFGMLAHSGGVGLATNWSLYSHFAVDIFIVLSGFCLILPVRRAGRMPTGVLAFYARRAWRILPPFYAALGFSLLIVLATEALRHQSLGFSAHALLINATLLQDVFLDQNIFNGPFWSIAVEWRIYFLFPIVVWSLMRFGALRTIAWTAICGYAVTAAIFRWEPTMFMASPWYLLLFTLGACAGWSAGRPVPERRVGEKIWIWVCVACTALAAVLVARYPITLLSGGDFGLHMPYIDAAVGGATAAFLILLAQGGVADGSFARRFLSSRPLVGLGRFSYSLYLTHLPCLLLMSQMLGFWSLSPGVKVAVLAFLGVPLAIGFAYLFFYVCERPFLKPPAFRMPVFAAARLQRSEG